MPDDVPMMLAEGVAQGVAKGVAQGVDCEPRARSALRARETDVEIRLHW